MKHKAGIQSFSWSFSISLKTYFLKVLGFLQNSLGWLWHLVITLMSKSLCYRDKVHNPRWQKWNGVQLRTKFGFTVFCQLCCNDLWMPGLGQGWSQAKLRSRWEWSATLPQFLIALMGVLFPSLDLFDILVQLYIKHSLFWYSLKVNLPPFTLWFISLSSYLPQLIRSSFWLKIDL